MGTIVWLTQLSGFIGQIVSMTRNECFQGLRGLVWKDNIFSAKIMLVMEMNGYQMGIVWGIGGFAEDRFICRHKERYFLEKLQTGNTIYPQTSKGKTQYVLKTRAITLDDLPGWTARNASERDIPLLDDYKDFLRAYIELHGCLDYHIGYKRKDKSQKYKHLRLRIYGNNILIQSANILLHENCCVGLKSIQRTVNDTTKYISYAAFEEILRIFEYIDGCPRFQPFWDDIDAKLRQPYIYI